jgi:hypothetical protein
MVRERGVVVELVELGMLLVLVVWVAQLRARERRMAREVKDLSFTVSTVEAWAVRELRALWNAARVDASAVAVLEQIQQARAASPAPPPNLDDEPRERRELAAIEEQKPEEDDEQTTVWTGPPVALVEAAARGAQASPQASRGGTTLLGFPLSQAQDEEDEAPSEVDDDGFKRDTLATPLPATSAPNPSDEDGDATTFFDPNQAPTTRRVPLMRPPALLAHGSEDNAATVNRGERVQP